MNISVLGAIGCKKEVVQYTININLAFEMPSAKQNTVVCDFPHGKWLYVKGSICTHFPFQWKQLLNYTTKGNITKDENKATVSTLECWFMGPAWFDENSPIPLMHFIYSTWEFMLMVLWPMVGHCRLYRGEENALWKLLFNKYPIVIRSSFTRVSS